MWMLASYFKLWWSFFIIIIEDKNIFTKVAIRFLKKKLTLNVNVKARKKNVFVYLFISIECY